MHDLLKNHANSSSIDTIKSPGKSRVLPAWMLNLSKTKGEPEKNSNNTSSHKGTDFNTNSKFKGRVMISKSDTKTNRSEDNTKQNGYYAKKDVKTTFLKTWSWAIGPLEDFSDLPNENQFIKDNPNDSKNMKGTFSCVK